MLKLVAFDLDGVLVDACDWHYQALNLALRDVVGFTISPEEHETIFNGFPTKKKLHLLNMQGRLPLDLFDIVEQKKQKYTVDLIEEKAEIDNSKIEFHSELKKLGLKLACVTNSIGETAALMLQKTGQLQFMNLLIHNKKVKNPKPHPEPYIKAMVYLHSLPEETLIVEDSEVGFQAARLTGANLWKVKGPSEVNWINFKKNYLK